MSEPVVTNPVEKGSLASRAAPPARGVGWLTDGFRSFSANWEAWLLIVVLSLLGSVLQVLLPLLGTIVVFLCTPVFVGGLMQGLDEAARQGRHLHVGDLFRAFSGPSFRPLIRIGLAWLVLVGLSLAVFAVFVVMFANLDTITQYAQSEDMLRAGRELTYSIGLLVGVLLFVALLVPITMLVWFAPALVVLEGESAGSAMKHSFVGCLRNFVPFLAYGLVGLVVFPLLVLLTFGLGVLVLLPVGLASIYAGYRDIFHRA